MSTTIFIQNSFWSPPAVVDSDNTVLLCHFNGVPDDATGNHYVSTSLNDGAGKESSYFDINEKFDSMSANFPFDKDRYITLPASNDWIFSDTAFTWEAWMRPSVIAVSRTPTIFSQYFDNNNRNIIMVNVDKMQVYEISASIVVTNMASPVMSAASWSAGSYTHFAWVKGYNGNLNDWAFYTNGNLFFTASSNQDWYDMPQAAPCLGGYMYNQWGGTIWSIGDFAMDELRYTKEAVYTDNFDVATEPFTPADSFLPRDLNPAQWYEPRQIWGGELGSWRDVSGNSTLKHLTRFTTATSGLLNGYKTAIFGTDGAMYRGTADVFDTPSFTVFVAVKMNFGVMLMDYGNPNNKLVWMGASGSAGHAYFNVRDAEADLIDMDGANAIPMSNSGSFEIFCFMCDGPAQTTHAFTGGGFYQTASNASYDGTTTWEGRVSTWNYQVWAGWGAGSVTTANGSHEFAETMIFNETKSVADINDIGNYLADKFALSWTDF